MCHWGTHIQGKYHKVNKIINNWLKCFCWYKNHEITYHHWGSCKECFHRLDESSNEDDPRFHEENEYNPEHDIEAKQAIALLQSTTNYVCTVCDVMCYSEEFYKKHLSGRKHRTYLSRINGDVDCSYGSTQKRKEQNKSQVQREKTSHKTLFSTSGHEPKQIQPQVQKGKTSKTSSSTTAQEGSSRDPTYYAVCDIHIKEKRNMHRHKKTKQHKGNLMKNHHNKQPTKQRKHMIMRKNMALL